MWTDWYELLGHYNNIYVYIHKPIFYGIFFKIVEKLFVVTKVKQQVEL